MNLFSKPKPKPEALTTTMYCTCCGIKDTVRVGHNTYGWQEQTIDGVTRFFCDHCWPVVQQQALTNYANGTTLRLNKSLSLLYWFNHYLRDRTWEKISPDKDFELREALKKAEGLCK